MHQPNLFPARARSHSAMTHDDAASGGDAHISTAPLTPRAAPQKKKSATRRRLVALLFGIEFIVAIMVRIFIGVIVLVLPWSSLWNNNPLLLSYPHLSEFLSYGATRGVFSGIGLLNLWIAVDDTLHRGDQHI
jgi:hypothetical protein